MDNCLPQVESFDFEASKQFDPIAFEQNLAYPNRPGSPQPVDDANFSYTGMLEDAVGEMDWMGPGPLDIPLVMEMEMEHAIMQERDETGQPRGGSSLAATPSTASYRTINELSKSNDNGQSSIRDVTRSPDGQRTPFMLAGVDQDATSLNNKKPLFAYHLQECSWESCDESNTSQDHLEIHAINARNKWSPNSKCTWEGCLSKALFAKLTKYNHHLMNIHTEPLICSSRGCSYKKPFRNQNDLDRHWITAHAASTQVFECPYKSCEQPNRTFVRKDKWLQHIREVRHLDDAFCPYFHCSLVRDGVSGGFNDRKAISRHFSNVHDAFQGKGMQCGLASCGKEDRGDFWAERGLESHLDLQHGIRCQWKAIKHMREALRRVFLVEDLADSSVDWYDKSQTEWHDCSICSPQDQPEKFTTKHTKWYPRS